MEGHRRLRGQFGGGGGGQTWGPQQPGWASHGHLPDAVNVRIGLDHSWVVESKLTLLIGFKNVKMS